MQIAVGALLGGPVGALAGFVTGAVFGLALARGQVYPPTARGAALFALDHSWSLPNTVAGSIYLAAQGKRHLDQEATIHSGRIYVRQQFIPGYATTVGTVIAGCTPRLKAHEDLHVRQARILGPLYLPLVVLGYVLASVFPYWFFHRDRDKVKGPVSYFSCGVYPHVWHELWAYRADRRRAGQLPRSPGPKRQSPSAGE
jgi:hypothetical protein